MPLSVVGVLTDQSGPLSPQVVWLEPGVNAVYGLNGSGKSYFLESLLAHARGNAWLRGGLIARFLPDPEGELGRERHEQRELGVRFAKGSWGPRLTLRSFSSTLQTASLPDPDGRDLFGWNSGAWGVGPPDEQDEENNAAIISEVLEHGYLLLVPRKTDPPTWTVWPMVLPTSDTPALLAEVRRLQTMLGELVDVSQRVYESLEEDESEDQIQQDIFEASVDLVWDSGLSRSLLMCSRNVPSQPDNVTQSDVTLDGAVFLRSLGFLEVAPCDVLANGVPQRRSVALQEGTIEAITRVCLVRRLGEGRGETITAAESISKVAEELSTEASRVLAQLLVDPLDLTLQVGDLRSLVEGTTPSWSACAADIKGEDRLSRAVSIEQLSSAQRRWAEFAIRLVIQERSRRAEGRTGETWLWVIDEPESAMHRSAEEFLAAGLVHLSDHFNVMTVLATHSPEVLDDESTRVLQARNDDGSTEIAPLDTIALTSLRDLGLRPSDLLRRQRVFVLVEGQHELVILGAVLGDELKALRAQLLPARGARNFATVFDSPLIFDYTDAQLLLTIDNIKAEQIRDVWKQTMDIAAAGNPDAAATFFRESLPAGRSAENKFLQEFCSGALRSGRHERFSVFGFSLPDINEYLPVGDFAPFSDWPEARNAWSRSGSKDPFKIWLTRAYSADFSDAHLASVAGNLDAIPLDFTAFLQTVAASTRSA